MTRRYGLFRWIFTILLYSWTGRTGHGLVMRGLEGPSQSVTRGEDIFLYCRYDLEAGDRLYAVKWFHGTREFYRFQPEMHPPYRFFPIDDVYVDIESSDAEKLVIRNVVPGTSGIYRCEVSAEETFETDYREMNITIADTPLGDPVIYNIQSSYAVGDELRINCTSFGSHPAARLHWLVNGQLKENDDIEVTHYPTRRSSSSPSSVSWWPNRHGPSLETSTTVGLHIKRLTHEHFSGGQLTVVCTASIDSTHQRSSTAKAFMDRARQTGPLVNPLRPSTLSTQPTAAADKRRSAQQTTGIRSYNNLGVSHRMSPKWTTTLMAIFLSVSTIATGKMMVKNVTKT